MYETIKDKNILKALKISSPSLRNVELRKLLNKADEETLLEVLKIEGSLIALLDEEIRDNKKYALESVTYRSFFYREVFSDYHVESVGNIDNLMLYEVDTAYSSISDRLKRDIDIVKAAKKSIDDIIKFLEKNDKYVDYNGFSILMDNKAMIEMITEESLPLYEELIWELENE
jgi:hypothetical protein